MPRLKVKYIRSLAFIVGFIIAVSFSMSSRAAEKPPTVQTADKAQAPQLASPSAPPAVPAAPPQISEIQQVSDPDQAEIEKAAADTDIDSGVSTSAKKIKKKKSKKDYKAELDLTEKLLEDADAQSNAKSEKNEKTIKSKEPPQFVLVGAGKGPQLINSGAAEDFSDKEHDVESRAGARNVSAKQARQDVQSARETLLEVRKERLAKKNHKKTKEELRQEKLDRQYIQAINKAYHEHGVKTDRTQVINTGKGKLRMVFINENDFSGENKAAKVRPDVLSREMKEALRDRGPSSADNELEATDADR